MFDGLKLFVCGLVSVSIALSHAAELGPEIVYSGMCDASAGIAISNERFAVADDETNELRSYSFGIGGPPLALIPLGPYLGLGKKKAELDLEGAAQVGDTVYWITSHGRNKDGKEERTRQFFFASKISTNGQIKLSGLPYRNLLRDLSTVPHLAKYKFSRASLLAPKDFGGLNIEGLAAGPNGSVLIAFRNPVIYGKALIIPMLNPGELVARVGASAKFGTPFELELGGKGIRDITTLGSDYLIIAGEFDSGGASEVFRWDGQNQPELLHRWPDNAWNAEAVFAVPGRNNEFTVLSDDGSRKRSGVDCKKLPVSQRRFRGVTMRILR